MAPLARSFKVDLLLYRSPTDERLTFDLLALYYSYLGFRQFLLRGLENVTGEWNLVCLAYNVKRLFNLNPA